MTLHTRIFAMIISAVTAISALHLANTAAAQESPARPGYMIVITQDVNPAGMRDYAKAAVPLMMQYKGKLLFATAEGKNDILEGGPYTPSVRVFEFPSLAAARGYYESDAYQAAIPLRADNGKITVLLSDAFIPDPKWSQPQK